MGASNYWVMWAVGLVFASAILGYLVMEYLAWLDRSEVLVVPAGLRFVARNLQVEMQRAQARFLVTTDHGHFTQGDGKDAPAQEKSGALSATLNAIGLRFSIEKQASGVCTLLLENVQDHALLRIERVPPVVARNFETFSQQAALWIEKLELRKKQQEQAEADAEASRAAEALAAEEAAARQATLAAAATEISPDAQVALWRKNAGFSGSSSEIGLDDKGRIQWFVDLDAAGRITLHSDRRTVHTTLAGAEITALGGELELAVRDSFWTLEDPKLERFRILNGRSPDERRAWKERLEILRNQLRTQTPAAL